MHNPREGWDDRPNPERTRRLERIPTNYDLIVIGAGPAGLSAAVTAAQYGVETTVIDENMLPGGQLFKQIHRFFGSKEHFAGTRGFVIGEHLLKQAEDLHVNVKLNTCAWGIFENNEVGLYDQEKVEAARASNILVATGASEKPLAFPGWTLPGVMGAGATQTMINVYRVLPGRRVLMVGSGNVGLIVSYQLLQAGAEVAAVIEALPNIGGWQVHANKIARMGVPIYTSHTIIKAEQADSIRSATIAELDRNFRPIVGTEEDVDVDLICLAVGLAPDVDLFRMAGCRIAFNTNLGGYVPITDSDLQTTIPGLFSAGDAAGIGEATAAMEEGRLVGTAIAEKLGKLTREEADEQKKKIHERLNEIRTGPYGAHLKEAKDAVTM